VFLVVIVLDDRIRLHRDKAYILLDYILAFVLKLLNHITAYIVLDDRIRLHRDKAYILLDYILAFVLKLLNHIVANGVRSDRFATADACFCS
jgi:hypothetical protein